MNTNFNLGWVPIYFLGYCVQAVWTGIPTGYFILNASADDFLVGTDITPPQKIPIYSPPQIKNPIRSNIISGSQYNVVAAGSNAWNVNGARYNFVQLAYVDQSGGASTAVLTFVNVNQKSAL